MTRSERPTLEDNADGDDNHLLVNEAASDVDDGADSDDNQQLLKNFEEHHEDDFQVVEIPSDEEDELKCDVNGLGESDNDDNEDNEDNEESPEEDNTAKKRMLWSDPGVNVAELSDDEEDVDDNGPLRRVGNVRNWWMNIGLKSLY